MDTSSRATTGGQAPPTGQSWNADTYAANGRFVAKLGSPVVALLSPQPGQHILDVGCGDGALTAQLAATGANVTGIDASPAMIEAARTRHPDVHLISATDLPFRHIFDAAFSNAALHWIPVASQPAALTSIHRSLKPGGRIAAEMGGLGNIAAIRTALSAALQPFGLDAEALADSFFPSPAHYRRLLEQAGFEVRSIDLIPRPTALPGGPDGMVTWLNTFRNGVLDRLASSERAAAVTRTVELLRPILFDLPTDTWTADYVRLRFLATAV